jgi:hypothetical protein
LSEAQELVLALDETNGSGTSFLQITGSDYASNEEPAKVNLASNRRWSKATMQNNSITGQGQIVAWLSNAPAITCKAGQRELSRHEEGWPALAGALPG